MKKLTLFLFLLSITVFSLAQKKNQLLIPKINVVDKPVIQWVTYPKDTINLVASSIQTFSVLIKSRLPLHLLEIRINDKSTDFYKASDFSQAVSANRYEQVIEPTSTFRTGLNTIIIVVTNTSGTRVESSRKVLVDPNQISILRNKKDQNAPMILVSDPANIKEDRVVIYQDNIMLTGTVIDESGIQLLKVNGIDVPVKENGLYKTYFPLNVGENQVTIEAKDLNQNIALKKFTIERKNTDGSVYKFEDAKNYLIVIGANNYKSWPPLFNAVSDAESLVKVLAKNYTFEMANVTMLLDSNATRANIYRVLRSHIEKVSSQDNLMIYYSGHGYFDKLLNEGYWVPIDADKNETSSYVPNADILKMIQNINSQHTFLVADACFSGSLFASTTRGYSDHVEKYKSRWGLASGRLEVVSDGVQGKNSPFAESFIGFLSDNKEPKIPVSDLIFYVKKRVADLNEQTPLGNPLKGVGDEGGEFIFYKRPN